MTTSVGDRLDVEEVEYIAVGGMLWASDHWSTGGMNAEWGDDAFQK